MHRHTPRHTPRRARRLLALAAAVALAATAGPAALPATAAPAAGADGAETAVAAVPRIPTGREIIAAGPTGFLTWDPALYHQLGWTRYADGVTKKVGNDSGFHSEAHARHGGLSDTIAVTDRDYAPNADRVTLRRMDKGTQSTVGLKARGLGYLGATGSSVIAYRERPGKVELHLLDLDGTRVTDRTVTGMPSPAHQPRVTALGPGTFVLTYQTGPELNDPKRDVLVDAKAGKVLRTYDSASWGTPSLSARHIVWSGRQMKPGTRAYHNVVRVAELGSADVDVRLTSDTEWDGLTADLLDDWLVSGVHARLGLGRRPTDYALYAEPLAGGPRKRLLDHASSVVPGPAGTLLAMGGTLARGEGLYRIAKGADGKPAATLLGSTGEPTKVTLYGQDVPSVARLDGDATLRMRWQVSVHEAKTTLVLRHKATGLTTEGDEELTRVGYEQDIPYDPSRTHLEFRWPGIVRAPDGRSYRRAPNGAYTWTLTVAPVDGIGPDLKVGGTVTVRRSPAPHDLTDDSTPDLLGLTPTGRLYRQNSVQYGRFTGVEPAGGASSLGTGWDRYSALALGGNVLGSVHPDLLTRDTAGVLWVHPGKGDGKFAERIKVGSGWNTYAELAASGDLTGDGRADLLARDTSGVLWLYRGTGRTSAPYRARTRVGPGWGIYDKLVAPGNVAGGGARDLLARDRAGVLWLYRGRGDGTFTARSRAGQNWNRYRDIVAWGDADGDGKPDLYVRGKDGKDAVQYGTGNATYPFSLKFDAPGFLTGRSYRSFH